MRNCLLSPLLLALHSVIAFFAPILTHFAALIGVSLRCCCQHRLLTFSLLLQSELLVCSIVDAKGWSFRLATRNGMRFVRGAARHSSPSLILTGHGIRPVTGLAGLRGECVVCLLAYTCEMAPLRLESHQLHIVVLSSDLPLVVFLCSKFLISQDKIQLNVA